MIPPSRLFVYGTLKRGSDNRYARLLEANSEFLGTGRMHGRVFNLGPYPGAVPSKDPGDWVPGELFYLLNPAKIFKALDTYEGVDFSRTMVTIRLDSGEEMDSWAYLYQGKGIRAV